MSDDRPATVEYPAPFLWVSLDVVRHLRERLDGRAFIAARSAYFALAELHAEQTEPTKPAIADRCGMSERHVIGHLACLETLGLLEIVHRKTTTGADASTVYRLLARPVDPVLANRHFSRGDETSPHPENPAVLQVGRSVTPGASRGDASSPQFMPHFSREDETSDPHASRGDVSADPAGARHDAVSLSLSDSANAESSTTTQERERVNSIDAARALWPALTQTERDVLKQLVELAKTRGLHSGWDPETAIGYIRGEFRNRDHVDQAVRFREYYSPGGVGENRSFTNLAARWRNWLKLAPTADTVVELGRRRGRPGQTTIDPAAVRAQAQDELKRSDEARRRRRERDEAYAAGDVA
jgi:hypothetical protein